MTVLSHDPSSFSLGSSLIVPHRSLLNQSSAARPLHTAVWSCHDLSWQRRGRGGLIPREGKEIITEELFIKALLRPARAVLTCRPETG